MNSRTTIAVLLIVLMTLINGFSVRAMSSTNYQIYWDSVNMGGEDTSSSTNYSLRDTIGEYGTGFSSSTNYQIGAGYRVADVRDPFISLTLGTQENDTRTAYGQFSSTLNTVVVSSTTPFTVGDYIVVHERTTLSDFFSTGQITNISASTITVDVWAGEPGSLSAEPSGSDDFIYRANGSAAELGVQSTTSTSMSVTRTQVTSNWASGYSIVVFTDGELRTSSTSITTVSDGAVTAGSEEYGAEAVGASAVASGTDLSFSSTSTQAVQRSTAPVTDDRIALVYKLAINASTPAGNYQQLLTLTATINY